MRRPVLLLSLLTAGCVTVPVVPPPVAAPPFVAECFFAGATDGIGTLRVAFRKPVTTHVEGRGRVEPDGTLVLDQTVVEGDKAPTTRQWRIRAAAPGRYIGTLTDAAGPVAGTVAGNRLHLIFAMKGGLHADQKLDLAPDGQSAHNIMVITKVGVTVASLDETIRRVP